MQHHTHRWEEGLYTHEVGYTPADYKLMKTPLLLMAMPSSIRSV